MSSHDNPAEREIARIEAERVEFKKTAERTLRGLFADVLPSEVLESRLSVLRKTVFVTRQELDRMGEENPKEDGADGLIRYQVDGHEVRRSAVVLHSASRAETLHTLLHEGSHLMAPESYVAVDYMRDEDEQVYSVYLGPLRHSRFVKTGEVDPLSVDFRHKPAQRALFWEAVTDWLADEALKDILTEKEKEEVSTSGYLERHYIQYLVDHAPDRPTLVRAVNEAYATGSEDPFRLAMEKLSGTKDDVFYEELLDVLKIGIDRWEERIEKWMEVVDTYFAKGKLSVL